MAASLVRWKFRTICPQIARLTQQLNQRSAVLLCQRNHVKSSLHHVCISLRLLSTSQRCLETASGGSSPNTVVKAPVVKAPETEDKVQAELRKEDEPEYLHRERYIPITRQSIIRHLIQEKDFLTEKEQKIFPDFALALDSALVNKYHVVLQDLKTLFDPINPDKDTVKSREWTRREKLDNEFWLLQQLEDVMEKANFNEVPKEQVHEFLKEHQAHEGVRVSVDPNRYDVLRFWVLGYERPDVQLSFSKRLLNQILRRSPRPPMEYYKRVVVAIRLKKDSKLILKAFKEVPIQNIEMLLPDGSIRMSTMDKGILTTSVAVASFGILVKLVTILANLHVDWSLLLTLITGTVAFRAWSTYKNRRNAYMVDHSRMLYFKNIANNRGLLTLLVDRAQDESFKEALLTYAFLLHSRPAELRSKSSDQYSPNVKGGLTDSELENAVEDWIKKKTGVQLEFDSEEAIEILRNLGLLSTKGETLNVMMLDAACRILPQAPQSVIARGASATDISEGFDRDEYLETEEEYKDEEKKARKYGWF